ncbi:unnamed protein product [Pedinophyceae sp. YPF-701]|nr:unnamed protein product [Pedinophyceae sp. YPF-701]
MRAHAFPSGPSCSALHLLLFLLLASLAITRAYADGALRPEDGAPGLDFGRSLALVGETALVGAPHGRERARAQRSGAGYVFQRRDGGWRPVARLAEPGPNNEDGEFGAAVALADERTAVVGAPGAHGRVHVYAYERGRWRSVSELRADDGRASRFGAAVAADSDTIVVGAPGEASEAGGCFVATRAGGTWVLGARLRPWGGLDVSGGRFGAAVAVSGDLAAVGAPGVADGAGAVFVFRRVGGAWAGVAAVSEPRGTSAELGASLSLAGGLLAAGGRQRSATTCVGCGQATLFALGADGALERVTSIAPGRGCGSVGGVMLGASVLACRERDGGVRLHLLSGRWQWQRRR